MERATVKLDLADLVLGKIPDCGREPWPYALVDRYPEGHLFDEPQTMIQIDGHAGHRYKVLWNEYTRAIHSRTASPKPELHGADCAVYSEVKRAFAGTGYLMMRHESLPECDGKECMYFDDPGGHGARVMERMRSG